MKSKTFIIIVIIATTIIPSTLALNQVFNNNELIQVDYIPVWFCCGTISNLHIYKVGYSEFYAFDAENVICRPTPFPIPFFLFFRHYSNGEALRIASPIYHGIIKEDFVWVIAF